MYSVLVVYAYHRFPLRPAIKSHLYCFQKSRLCRATYVNLRYRRLGPILQQQRFDLVIFDTTFTGQRWNRERFTTVARKAMPLKEYPAPKALIPQDDFLNADQLVDFVNECAIDYVFSVWPESEWPAIYSGVRSQTRFQRVLTGYLDPESLSRIQELAAENQDRPIDIGYRTAWQYWFGRHCRKRQQLAELVSAAAPEHDLVTNIDTGQKKESDRLRGDDWFRYMLQCRCVLGTDGGTSILDRNGSIRACTEAYLAQHPDADFEDVERECFPGKDGLHRLRAISPRHLEACATRTCQILLEGEYNGILLPGKHYLEIKNDYSNLHQVLKDSKRPEIRQRITDQAHQDIVASGQYLYERFVEQVLDTCLKGVPPKPVSFFQRWLFTHWMRLCDKLSWIIVRFVDTYFKPPH